MIKYIIYIYICVAEKLAASYDNRIEYQLSLENMCFHFRVPRVEITITLPSLAYCVSESC